MSNLYISNPDIRRFLSYLLWPLIYFGGLAFTSFALASKHPLVWFNVVYFSTVLLIMLLERIMPHEPLWIKSDGETFNNIAHTLFTKGLVQITAGILISLNMVAVTIIVSPEQAASSIWPHQWPLFAQVVLAIVIAELGLYIAHRTAHEVPTMWRFHALHHSVKKLWVINTGRFHFVDSLFKIALSQTALFFMGAPLSVFLWFSAVTAFTGLLTHCNVEMRTGVLNYLFTTPGLHRWHHSKNLDEGNRNYGENIVIWDLLLGTYYNEPRRPPADIGIHGEIAKNFFSQLAQPFTKKGAREIFGESSAD